LAELADERLLAIAQHGDSRAFATLCARYRYSLFVYCRRRVGDRGIAEDVVQETLLAAWQHLDVCQQWRGWLYTIARNRCATTLRLEPRLRCAPQPTEILDRQAQHTADPAIIHEQRDCVSRLFAASANLPPRQQQVISRRLAGARFRDIAAQLGITEKVARQAAYDARQRLRATLE
jgi:RNA polymerase sigma-70 factor (ECF subfamily)